MTGQKAVNAIRVIKKDKTYYIYNDAEYLGGIYRRDFEKLGIITVIELDKLCDASADDKKISEFYIENVSDDKLIAIRDEVINKGFNKSVALATARECSADVIRTKLKLKKYPDSAIDAVIELMYSYNYINDERFVEAYVRSYMMSKSRRMIEMELEDRGIDVSRYGEVIDTVYLDENVDTETVVKELLRKKYGNDDLSDERIKRRAAAYLHRHGFGYDVIKLYLT